MFLTPFILLWGLLPWVAASNSSRGPYNTTYDPTNYPIFQLSADSDFAFYFEQLLALAPAEGASSGEVLRLATQVPPNSIEGTYNAFFPFAEKIYALAESIDPSIDPVGARETYFRASTYYRSSVFYLVGNASDPRLYTVWPKMLDSFHKAIALLEPAPGLPITLHAKNSSIGAFKIPAYFYKGSKSNQTKLPTIIVSTGYDGAQQDLYALACGEILKRGINCITYEGPGQPTVRRTQFLPFIPDWWSVVTPVLDWLEKRPDVDMSKIALHGDSFGGSLALIAASEEPRLSATMLLDGLPNFRQVLIESFPRPLVALYNESKVEQFNEAVDQIINSVEYPMDFRVVLAYTLWVFNTTKAYDAWTGLGNVFWRPKQAAKIGSMPVYVAKSQDDNITYNEPQLARHYLDTARPNGRKLTHYHEFLTSYGAGEHTSLGAESQVWVSILGWLSKIWGGYQYRNNM